MTAAKFTPAVVTVLRDQLAELEQAYEVAEEQDRFDPEDNYTSRVCQTAEPIQAALDAFDAEMVKHDAAIERQAKIEVLREIDLTKIRPILKAQIEDMTAHLEQQGADDEC